MKRLASRQAAVDRLGRDDSIRLCRSASAAERGRAGRPTFFCRRMAIPILWRDGSRIESRGQEQNRASGAFASPSLPIRELQWAYSLLLLSAACAMRASFRGPFLPSTPGCLSYFNACLPIRQNDCFNRGATQPWEPLKVVRCLYLGGYPKYLTIFSSLGLEVRMEHPDLGGPDLPAGIFGGGCIRDYKMRANTLVP